MVVPRRADLFLRVLYHKKIDWGKPKSQAQLNEGPPQIVHILSGTAKFQLWDFLLDLI